jgi:SLT domain-containing protein
MLIFRQAYMLFANGESSDAVANPSHALRWTGNAGEGAIAKGLMSALERKARDR